MIYDREHVADSTLTQITDEYTPIPEYGGLFYLREHLEERAQSFGSMNVFKTKDL